MISLTFFIFVYGHYLVSFIAFLSFLSGASSPVAFCLALSNNVVVCTRRCSLVALLYEHRFSNSSFPARHSFSSRMRAFSSHINSFSSILISHFYVGYSLDTHIYCLSSFSFLSVVFLLRIFLSASSLSPNFICLGATHFHLWYDKQRITLLFYIFRAHCVQSNFRYSLVYSTRDDIFWLLHHLHLSFHYCFIWTLRVFRKTRSLLNRNNNIITRISSKAPFSRRASQNSLSLCFSSFFLVITFSHRGRLRITVNCFALAFAYLLRFPCLSARGAPRAPRVLHIAPLGGHRLSWRRFGFIFAGTLSHCAQ